MRILIAVLLFSFQVFAEDTPKAKSVAQPAPLSQPPSIWLGAHGGFYARSPDGDLESDWKHQVMDSYLIGLRGHKRFELNHLGNWYWLVGGEYRHGTSIDKIGSSRIQVDIDTLSIQTGIGSEAFVLSDFGGYAYFSYRVVGDRVSRFHSHGINHKIDTIDDRWLFGVVVYYKLTENLMINLTGEGGVEAPITLGLTYAL